jgi:uncharacterized protein
MKHSWDDPRHLDVAMVAKKAASLTGTFDGAAMVRLQEPSALPSDAQALPPITWSVRGEHKARAGGEPLLWMHLKAHATVARTCQRCLQPVLMPLAVDNRLRFVIGEDEAARLDAELDEDVLALEPKLDLMTLVEDELLLAVPPVPSHEDCAMPWHAADALPEPIADDGLLHPGDSPATPGSGRDHPFAGLAVLKRKGKAS